MRKWMCIFGVGLSLFLIPRSNGFAQSQPPADFQGLAKEVMDGFSYHLRTYAYGIVQEPSDSTQNPQNLFLRIPSHTAAGEVRADFRLDFRAVKFLAKPRATGTWQQWDGETRAGDKETETDFFLNEWLAGINLTQNLFASYGRENVQWGPSFLLSPSNPFFRDNGLSNPIREVPGMEFASLSWTPNSTWSLSFRANTSEGRQNFIIDEFKRTYALKLDGTMYRKYASLILSYREGDRARLGAFGGWTFSDALFLYGEGTVTQGNRALYPVQNQASPFGIQMSFTKEDDPSAEGILLLGASYTVEAGPTLTLEYVFNSEGYNGKEADLYLELRRRASVAFFLSDPVYSAAQSVLGQTLDPGLRLLRQHYLFFQYQHTRMWRELDVILRFTLNLDDQSSQFNPILQYAVGRNIQLFLVGSQNFGAKDTEFRSLVDYSWMLGLKYSF